MLSMISGGERAVDRQPCRLRQAGGEEKEGEERSRQATTQSE